MYMHAGKMFKDLGYAHLFGPSQKEFEEIPEWIVKTNEVNL